jgi:hypothetical protein
VPPELVQQWIDSNIEEHTERLLVHGVADKAAQWGADQQLRKVNDWIRCWGDNSKTGIRWELDIVQLDRLGRELWQAMRPKPPSLAEQGLEALRGIKSGTNNCREQDQAVASLAAALTRLAELEAQQ